MDQWFQSNSRHLTVTFVISAFQMPVLHFGNFFRKPEKKLGSHTRSKWWPGDPATRTWKMTQMTQWPRPSPCLVHPAHQGFLTFMRCTSRRTHSDKFWREQLFASVARWWWLAMRWCMVAVVAGVVFERGLRHDSVLQPRQTRPVLPLLDLALPPLRVCTRIHRWQYGYVTVCVSIAIYIWLIIKTHTHTPV